MLIVPEDEGEDDSRRVFSGINNGPKHLALAGAGELSSFDNGPVAGSQANTALLSGFSWATRESLNLTGSAGARYNRCRRRAEEAEWAMSSQSKLNLVSQREPRPASAE